MTKILWYLTIRYLTAPSKTFGPYDHKKDMDSALDVLESFNDMGLLEDMLNCTLEAINMDTGGVLKSEAVGF